MKILKYIAATGALTLAAFGLARAARVVYSQNLVNETALAYNNTYTLDLGNSLLAGSNMDSLSFQAVYSSASISNVTFIDGTKSTATITINNFSQVASNQASDTLTVAVSTTQLAKISPLYFTLNGYTLMSGDLWNIGTSSADTAANIKSAINSYGAVSSQVVASTASGPGIVTITAISSGTTGNTFTLTSSSQSALTVSTSPFKNGRNHSFIVINGVTLTEGTDFNAVTSSHVTAGNLRNAIFASSVTIGVTASTSTAGGSGFGVVFATSVNVGSNTNFGIFSSNVSSMTPTNNRMYGGTDSNVVSSVITKTNHNLTTGLAVLFSTTTGSIPPQNLVNQTTYYAIRIDGSNFKLASSLTNAKAGTAITISTVTGGGSFTLAPLGITGTPSFKWQYSNDNANWNDLTTTVQNVTISSITMTSLGAASTVWDFGNVNFRYLRLNVIAPTQGGISLVVSGIGKSSN